MVMAYVIWSSYAFNQAETGEYRAAEAYSEGPMATLATVFYAIFGITIVVMIGAPVLAFLITVFGKQPSDS